MLGPGDKGLGACEECAFLPTPKGGSSSLVSEVLWFSIPSPSPPMRERRIERVSAASPSPAAVQRDCTRAASVLPLGGAPGQRGWGGLIPLRSGVEGSPLNIGGAGGAAQVAVSHPTSGLWGGAKPFPPMEGGGGGEASRGHGALSASLLQTRGPSGGWNRSTSQTTAASFSQLGSSTVMLRRIKVRNPP